MVKGLADLSNDSETTPQERNLQTRGERGSKGVQRAPEELLGQSDGGNVAHPHDLTPPDTFRRDGLDVNSCPSIFPLLPIIAFENGRVTWAY